MRHRLKRRVFDTLQLLSTFTTNSSGNPHSTRIRKLHSKSTYFYRWWVPGLCASALLFGGYITINPVLSHTSAHAEELDFIVDDTANSGDSNNDDIKLAANPTIALTITANSDGTNGNAVAEEVAYFSNNLTVTGTDISSYFLTISSPSDSSGNLVGQTNPAAIVGKVAAGTIPTQFSDNTWGYAISNNTTTANANMFYNPVPNGGGSSYLATKTSAPDSNGDNYKLVFAAKLGSNMPADHYKADVYVSVVASASLVLKLNQLSSMQDITPGYCSGVQEGDTAYLKDVRDGKYYWAAKLKDGNCWMTQNLDYDITVADIPSIKKITDITAWKITADGGVVDNDTPAYYDPGNYYYNGPNNKHGQGTICNSTSLGDCAEFSTTGTDQHYHVGNYYSWEAANKNTGATLTTDGDIASGSICPAGWKLPLSKETNNNVSGSFYYLLNQYGLVNTSTNDTTGYQIYNEPLYFVYGGYIFGGKISLASDVGIYWSSIFNTMFDGFALAYDLNFYNGVEPFKSHSCYNGMSVRCVAN